MASETYEKWKARGYLEGISESDGEFLATLMERGENELSREGEYSSGKDVIVGKTIFSYNMSDVTFKVMRAAFLQRNIPHDTAFDNSHLFSAILSKCDAYTSGLYTGKCEGLLDSVEHLAFCQKVGQEYAKANNISTRP